MANEATKLMIADIVETLPLTMVGNLPCPFCGGVNLTLMTPRNHPKKGAWVMCEQCSATGPCQPGHLSELGWNTRAFGPEIFIRPTDAERLVSLSDQSASVED